jgi:uncharacterized Ntn-hydrolase superfamily protein
MTYSIIARAPVSGEIGAAAFIGSPFVGGMVLWSKPGVGAVAMQGRTRLILADQLGQLDHVASLLKPLLRADEKWVRLVERYLEVQPLKIPGPTEQVQSLAGPKRVV